MNRTIKRKFKGSITQRSKDSLSLVIYVKADASGKPRQLWETVKREPSESDAQLRDRAEKRLAELLKKQDEGANIIAERLTLGKYLADWLDAYAADHRDSTTPQTYRYLLEKHIIPRIGSLMLPKVTAKHVEGVYREMRDVGLSGKTRLHVHRVLSLALKLAVRDGNLARNVCESVNDSLHSPDPPKLHKVTGDELRALIDAAASTDIAAIVPLLAFTGLRSGEALGLRWSDVDFDASELQVAQTRKRYPVVGPDSKLTTRYGSPKTEKSARTVPLSPPAIDALQKHHQAQIDQRQTDQVPDPIHNLVFTLTDGSPMNHDYVTHRWQKVRKAAGVQNARLHDLRHFAGTHMLEAGVPTHHVSAVLGHSTVTTTINMYARTNEQDKREAIAALAASMSGYA